MRFTITRIKKKHCFLNNIYYTFICTYTFTQNISSNGRSVKTTINIYIKRFG